MENVRRTSWGLAGAWILFLTLGLPMAGLSLDPSGNLILSPVLLIGLLLLHLFRRRGDPSLAQVTTFVETMFLFWVFGLAAAVTGYVVAGATRGYADALLAGADARLGFDWPKLYRWWTVTPTARALLRPAYSLISTTPLVTLAALAFSGRRERAWTFTLAFAMALIATNALFPLFPARSALVHHMGEAHAYVPAVAATHVDVIEGLRSGAVTSVRLDDLWGLVTFPSFHAAAAILFGWAAWPIRWLRAPATLANAMMLLATPIEGTHYLVDVIGGSAVAVLSITVAGRLGAAGTARSEAPRSALATA